MKMPWGIYKGQEIEDLSSDYLQWLVENCQDMTLFIDIFAEWQFREDFEDHLWQPR